MARWLERVSKLFDDDPLIDEYALMPEVSASLFGIGDESASGDEGCLAAEHKLAISVEAALLLYRHAHKAMLASSKGCALAAASRAVLLCSADCAGAWARREQLLRAEVVDVKGELHLSGLLLRTNHKSGETWAYRRHILAGALTTLPPDGVSALVATELELVEELARKYDHHYYAWNHWAWLERFCRAHHLSRKSGSATSLVGGSFPRLVHVTPSHYGLFHHRIVLLRHELLQSIEGAEFGEACKASGQELGQDLGLALPQAALEVYAAERQLSASLLATYPHLEAPWHFRLQLFAAVLDAVEAAASAGSPSQEALLRILDLWRSEVAFARGREASTETGGESRSATRAFVYRFQAHALQELAAHFHAWRTCDGCCTGTVMAAVEECLHAMKPLEAASAAAPAVLHRTKADLEDLVAVAKPGM